MVICNKCQYNGRLEFKGCCPICGSDDYGKVSEEQSLLSEAKNLYYTNILSIQELNKRAKKRRTDLRLKSNLG